MFKIVTFPRHEADLHGLRGQSVRSNLAFHKLQEYIVHHDHNLWGYWGQLSVEVGLHSLWGHINEGDYFMVNFTILVPFEL